MKCFASSAKSSNPTSGMSHAERREYYKKQRESNRIDYSGQPTPIMTTAAFYRSRTPGFDQYGRPLYRSMPQPRQR